MKNYSLKTQYAPAERQEWDEIINDFESIRSIEFINSVINALPVIAIILNRERQIVFANFTLINKLGIRNIQEILGNRPGEVLGCINASKTEGGCGTTERCKFCGAVNSILKSQATNSRAIDECRITSQVDGKQINYDFHVTAAPLYWLEKSYTLFTLLDISDEKRRRALERIFFHDILNKTGSLSGFLELINSSEDKSKIDQLLRIMEKLSVELNDEIIAQRELLSAENGELVTQFNEVDINLLMSDIIGFMSYNLAFTEKKIQIIHYPANIKLSTDAVLLKRILTNMIKNAMEASPVSSEIEVGGKSMEGAFRLWVKNPGFIPRETQLQIFQRSFSTKGPNRGLGTYSMKLLGENYLGGNVGFSSHEESGTLFYIDLPLK